MFVTERVRFKIAVDDGLIEQVAYISYLGLLMTCSGQEEKLVNVQVYKAEGVTGGMENKWLRKDVKSRIYKNC